MCICDLTSGKSEVIFVNQGYYGDPANFAAAVQIAIDNAFGEGIYTALMNFFTLQITITNTLGNPFSMTFDMPIWDTNIYTVCNRKIKTRYLGPENLEPYYSTNTLRPFTLGFQMGYRKINYTGQTAYTAEGIYNPFTFFYYYFGLNDFQNNRVDAVTGVLDDVMLDEDILAIVPLNAFSPGGSSNYVPGLNANILNTGADLMFKTRNYTGPVNLTKIEITIYSPVGNMLTLNGSPFIFVLDLKIQYSNPVYFANQK
jgi:hypothetical protein